MRNLMSWLVIMGLFTCITGCANKEMTLKIEKQEKEMAQLKEEKESLARQVKDLNAEIIRLKKEGQTQTIAKAIEKKVATLDMEQLSDLLQGIKLGGGSKPYLGISPDSKGSEKGLLIGQVIPDSPADKAGLKPGDIIIEVDWDPIKTKEDLENTLEYLKQGDKIEILIIRDRKEIKLTVELGEKKKSKKE